jgi:Rieske 2Fe-2S family protein
MSFSPILSEKIQEQLGSGPVASKRYWSEEYFVRERERIFRRTWLCVGRGADLPNPGDYIVREIETCGVSMLIARGRDGVVRAFYNVCSHRNFKVVLDERGTATRFTCKYHGWGYDLEGALKAVPDEKNVPGLDRRRCGLTPIVLDTCADFIFVNLDPKPAQNLESYLGDLYGRLAAFDVAGWAPFFSFGALAPVNWKCIADNFQETYHFNFTHRLSVPDRATGPGNAIGSPVAFEFFGIHRSLSNWGNLQHEPAPVEGVAAEYGRVAGRKWRDGAQAGPRHPNLLSEAYSLFPNTQIVIAPSRMHMTNLFPLDAGRTRWRTTVYYPRAKTAAERISQEYSCTFLRDIIAEDMSVFEHLQQGMRSGAKDAIYFHRNEILCRHFAAVTDEYVGAAADAQSIR